ncbi:tetratricopeptide repeat protein [Granulicella sp. dw_53]|uniref:tetratricopeptide repeat protein n=1 Tax=Granulicella sp. dw_53 TaxID=2719792 RepID=UPI001BD3DB01|nr:tetratricopeptide repeat protein [Granulicella sp. dw_53]
MPTAARSASILCFALLLLLPMLQPLAQAEDASIAKANTSLQQGKVDEAAATLRSILSTQPTNALAHQLLCRVFYAQEMADPAIHECELAISNAPNSSENHLWLGRAYGLKASHASPFTALGLAKKVRDEFERAVQLDPNAPRAASDLGQFYINAPGFVGGGSDKAMALITRIEPQFPVYSHRLRALLADKQSDSAKAEAEFKVAIAIGKSAAAWIDLADFYQRHKQPDQAVAAIQSALALQPKNAALVDAASILTTAHRSPDLAERLLREYLASPAKTDEAPAFKVYLQLGKLLAKRGDSSSAHTQYASALALASSFEPARKALQSS